MVLCHDGGLQKTEQDKNENSACGISRGTSSSLCASSASKRALRACLARQNQLVSTAELAARDDSYRHTLAGCCWH